MRKKYILLTLAFGLGTICSCGLVDMLLSNVNGYDLTACGRAPDVCLELAWDNRDKIK